MVCTDVGQVGAAGGDGMDVGGMLRNALGAVKGALDTKVINAADYVL